MKIAYIITSLAQEGPGNVVLDLVKVMMSHSHECTVYYFDTKENEHSFPCEVKKITFKNIIPFDSYDIVHTHSLRPDIYAFIHKPFFSKCHLICTIHNFVFQDLISDHGRFKGIIVGLLWQLGRLRNERLLVLNKTAFNYYRRWFGGRRLRIAYNTRVLDKTLLIIEDDIIKLKELRRKFSIICCSICRITDRKGLDQIIYALPRLSKNICFLIIGDGHGLQKLKKIVIKLQLQDRVIFFGGRPDGFRFLPFIDIFCIPSHSEGFPLAMLEAASYGKAILSSDIDVFKEIFSDKEIIICKENNVESVIDGINRLIPNIEVYGTNAKTRFDKDYSPEAFYNNHINIYTEIIK